MDVYRKWLERLISIHTPAQGVTCRSVRLLRYFSDFNPHSRTGSDSDPAEMITYIETFQSTLPHRE